MPHLESIKNIGGRSPDGIDGNKDPDHVEEDQVDPLVHEVAGVEVDVADKPLGTKGHEACTPSACRTERRNCIVHTAIELSCSKHDHGDVGTGVLLGNVVANPDSHGANNKDRQKFETDDALRVLLETVLAKLTPTGIDAICQSRAIATSMSTMTLPKIESQAHYQSSLDALKPHQVGPYSHALNRQA